MRGGAGFWDYEPVRLQHLLAGRRRGHHVGRLRELRGWHGQHGGLVLLHACYSSHLGGYFNQPRDWLWGGFLPCSALSILNHLWDAIHGPSRSIPGADVLRHLRFGIYRARDNR